MDTRKPSFRNFIAAFRGHTLDAMSGGFSVPFAAAGVVCALYAKDSDNARYAAIIFLVMAVGAMWFAAYRIWASERQKVVELHEQVDIVAATKDQTAAIREQTEENRRARLRRHEVTIEAASDFTQPALEASGPHRIQLAVGENDQFVDTKTRNLYTVVKTLNLSIHNLDNSRALKGIKAKVTALHPYAGSLPPWPLIEDFALNGGDTLLTGLVSYGEAIDRVKFNSADTFSQLCVIGTKPMLGADDTHILTIRVSAEDSHFEEIKVAIWTEEGRLRISEIVPLKKAAEYAYGKIRGTEIAAEIEQMAKEPLEITRLTAQQFLGRGVVWGNRWPSETPELIKSGKFVILDDIESLAHRNATEAIIRNAVVKQSDVNEYVRYILNISGGI